MATITLSDYHTFEITGLASDQHVFGACEMPFWLQQSEGSDAQETIRKVQISSDRLNFEEADYRFEHVAGNLWNWSVRIELGNLDAIDDADQPELLKGRIGIVQGTLDASLIDAEGAGLYGCGKDVRVNIADCFLSARDSGQIKFKFGWCEGFSI